MVAIPMQLDDALRFNGYTIDQTDNEAFDITVPEGTIHVPAMRISTLTWQRAGTPEPSDSFYLANLPIFADAYRPIILSHILDQYSTRRIGYDTLDRFGLAVRRWANLELGPQSILNRRYTSSAVTLPLDTINTHTATARNSTDNDTTHARNASSDFPQGQLAGDLDYSSFATDTGSDRDATSTGSETTDNTGRAGSIMALLEEQRATYLNVDAEVLASIETLFLGVWDRDERDNELAPTFPPIGILAQHW